MRSLLALILLASLAVSCSSSPKSKRNMGPAASEYKQEEVRNVISSHYSKVKSCIETGLKTNKNLRGNLVLSWTISDKGKAKKISSRKSTIRSRKVRNCAINQLKKWKFPAPPKGKEYEISFTWKVKK